MSETKKLIDNLCEDLKPCKPLAHPLLRMGPWVLLSLIYMAYIIIEVIGLRADWYSMLMDDTRYQLDIGLAVFLGVSSALTLGWVNLPDMRQQAWVMSVPAVALVLFISNIVYRCVVADYGTTMPIDMRCFYDTALIVGLPLLSLVVIIRKGCPSCHHRSALFAILTVTSLGWAGLRLTCGIDNVLQNFVIQFLPFVLIAIILSVFSGKFFKW